MNGVFTQSGARHDISAFSLIADLTKIPGHEVDRSYYSDWGDPREYTLADMGVGECAGQVVSQAEFTLAASERQLFEAQLLLDGGRPQEASSAAYASMLQAARGLVLT
jgi:sulfite reductase (ferredoxin)